MSFKNRVFGCAIVKAINANYNADFSHQPRTLPDGTVYATDKALKYLIKNYLKENYPEERVFYFKSHKDDFKPRTLEETYSHHFGKPEKGAGKKDFAKNLLSNLDIRAFGATFAMKATSGNVAISIHGPLQINHGINIWEENNIYSEQIMSPFANKEGADMSTLGQQSKLQEGHYVHHFSVNPKNLDEIVKLAGDGAKSLDQADIAKLKQALCSGATYFDSSSKAGIDNELLFWVQLKEGSKKVFPAFTNLIEMTKEGNTPAFDFNKVKGLLEANKEDIECAEVYYVKGGVKLLNLPSMIQEFDIISGKEL